MDCRKPIGGAGQCCTALCWRLLPSLSGEGFGMCCQPARSSPASCSCAGPADDQGRATGWGEHEMDYILFLRAGVTLDPNPEEVRVRQH